MDPVVAEGLRISGLSYVLIFVVLGTLLWSDQASIEDVASEGRFGITVARVSARGGLVKEAE